jgi:hypothetical protein
MKGDISRPDAITAAPTEIVLDDKTGKPLPTVVAVAAAAQSQRIAATPAVAAAPSSNMVAQAPASAQTAPADASPLSSLPVVSSASDTSQAFVKKWLNLGEDADTTSNVVKVYEPEQPVPADVPLPPRRNAAADSAGKPQASLKTPSFAALRAPGGALAYAGAPTQQ